MRDIQELIEKIDSGEEQASDWGARPDFDEPSDIRFYDKRTMKFVCSSYETELAELFLKRIGIELRN